LHLQAINSLSLFPTSPAPPPAAVPFFSHHLPVHQQISEFDNRPPPSQPTTFWHPKIIVSLYLFLGMKLGNSCPNITLRISTTLRLACNYHCGLHTLNAKRKFMTTPRMFSNDTHSCGRRRREGGGHLISLFQTSRRGRRRSQWPRRRGGAQRRGLGALASRRHGATAPFGVTAAAGALPQRFTHGNPPPNATLSLNAQRQRKLPMSAFDAAT
jgi:hypothetical protein